MRNIKWYMITWKLKEDLGVDNDEENCDTGRKRLSLNDKSKLRQHYCQLGNNLCCCQHQPISELLSSSDVTCGVWTILQVTVASQTIRIRCVIPYSSIRIHRCIFSQIEETNDKNYRKCDKREKRGNTVKKKLLLWNFTCGQSRCP